MLTFVRHAKTEFNTNRLFHGQKDIELSELGVQETIERSADFPKNFEICFCSPLKRTRQTAEILVPYLNPYFDDRLKERNMGDWEGTNITDEKLEQLREKFVPPNGEKLEEIDRRVAEFLKMIKEKYNDENVLVITHAGVLHAVGRVLNLNVESAEHLALYSVEL